MPAPKIEFVRTILKNKFWLGAALFAMAAQLPLLAATFELKDGTHYEGALVAQDAAGIVVETQQGMVNLRKADLKQLPPDVQPDPAAMPQETERVGPGASPLQEPGQVEKFFRWNPLTRWMILWVDETAAKSELRNISNAIAVFEADRGKMPKNFGDLHKAGLLEPRPLSPLYHYEFEPTSKGVRITARPAEENDGHHPIMMDESGVFIVESEGGKS
ncbi:MAG TPA: hypothetical protein VL688_06945 [Verrucomicrobiae bacterium]|jgi:hypothetical protein|nr:hypothetical protein [Verrucomicrobiae bacterium]